METSPTDDEVAEISAAFAAAGIPAEVLSDTAKGGGAGAIDWTLLVTLPATAYFAKLASEMATDHYNALKRVAGRIIDARKKTGRSPGSITFVDAETRTTFSVRLSFKRKHGGLYPRPIRRGLRRCGSGTRRQGSGRTSGNSIGTSGWQPA